MAVLYSDVDNPEIHKERLSGSILLSIFFIIVTCSIAYIGVFIIATKSIVGIIIFLFILLFVEFMMYNEMMEAWRALKTGVVLTDSELQTPGIKILLSNIQLSELVDLKYGGLCLIVKYQKEDESDFIRIVKGYTSDVSQLSRELNKNIKIPEQLEPTHFETYASFIQAHTDKK